MEKSGSIKEIVEEALGIVNLFFCAPCTLNHAKCISTLFNGYKVYSIPCVVTSIEQDRLTQVYYPKEELADQGIWTELVLVSSEFMRTS